MSSVNLNDLTFATRILLEQSVLWQIMRQIERDNQGKNR